MYSCAQSANVYCLHQEELWMPLWHHKQDNVNVTLPKKKLFRTVDRSSVNNLNNNTMKKLLYTSLISYYQNISQTLIQRTHLTYFSAVNTRTIFFHYTYNDEGVLSCIFG